MDTRAWYAPYSRSPRGAEGFPYDGFCRQLPHTFLIVPLRQQREHIGVLVARRIEVRPFTPAQIKLLETFADQAVIAIENVRLFNELKESLEQQTATSEILGVIASSPTDIQPVLDVVTKNAARLCDANDAQIHRVEGDMLRKVASYGDISPVFTVGEVRPITGARGFLVERVVHEGQTIHIHDYRTESEIDDEVKRVVDGLGIRTALAVPLLREGIPIGAILIRRTEVRPFTDKQIALLRTFADQAVIAIENVRLFKELQERNGDLTEALEQQTATSEILGVIASSPTEIEPVLDTVAKNAVRVCGAEDALIWRLHENTLKLVAIYSSLPSREIGAESLVDHGSVVGRAVIDRQTIHVEDLAAAAPNFQKLAWFTHG